MVVHSPFSCDIKVVLHLRWLLLVGQLSVSSLHSRKITYKLVQACTSALKGWACSPMSNDINTMMLHSSTSEVFQVYHVITFIIISYKCTKHKFIHLLTATFKDLHIENSKNYKR